MLVRLLVRFLIVASLVAWLLPAAAAARPVAYGAEVDGDFIYYMRHTWSWDQLQASLHTLRAAGATVARSNADWARTERKRPLRHHHRYDWKFDDMVVGALAAEHLRWDPMLGFTPKWAEQHIKPVVSHDVVSPVPPIDNRDYSAYVAAFARRYGVGGSFWRSHNALPQEPVETFEIWNEPDCRWTWGPRVNLQDYARLFSAAYQAIKRVDRQSMVITAGLAFNHSSLPRLLKAFKGIRIDGLGVHPYAANARATIAVVRWTDAQMIAYGRGRTPLVVNEYGWNYVTGYWQAISRRSLDQNIISAIVGLSKLPHVTAVIPFEWANERWGLTGGALARAVSQAQGGRG